MSNALHAAGQRQHQDNVNGNNPGHMILLVRARGTTTDTAECVAAGFSTISQEIITAMAVSNAVMMRGQGPTALKIFGARALERIHNGQCHR